MNINYWNQKIYRNSDDSFVEGSMGAKEFYEEFGIKSYPLFKDQCYYHVPARWADDVRMFVKQVQSELGDRITFKQIKEKWCWLTVYYSAADQEADERLKQLERECIDRLIAKDLHPARE